MSHLQRFSATAAQEPLVSKSLVPPPGYPLHLIDMTPSVRGALHSLGVQEGGDLAGITVKAFIDHPGIGLSKVADIRNELAKAANTGWQIPSGEAGGAASGAERPILYRCERPLVDFMADNLRLLNDRYAIALGARFGVSGPRASFPVIAERIGTSPNYAQQIYTRAYKRFGDETGCWDSIRSDFASISCRAPLLVEDVERREWTSGLPYEVLIQLAIEQGGLHLVPIKGFGPALVPFPGRDLARILVHMKPAVSAMPADGSPAGLIAEASGLLGEDLRPVCERVLGHIFRGCDGLGAMIVLGLDRAAMEALVPPERVVTLREAASRVARAMPDPPSATWLRRALGTHIGRHGDDRFARVPSREGGARIVDACIAAVMAGSPGRRWRLHELVAVVGRAMPFEEIPGEADLARLLASDGRLVGMGRGLWGDTREPDHGGDAVRAVEIILERNGGPLRAKTVKERVGLLWGKLSNPQVPAVGSIVQTRRGVWGLAHRDLPLDEKRRSEVARVAEASLASGTTSARAILAALPAHLSSEMADEYTLASVLREFGFKLDQRGNLRCGREAAVHAEGSLACAIETALRRTLDGITLEEAKAIAARDTGKSASEKSVRAVLRMHGKRHPDARQRWILNDGPGPRRSLPKAPPNSPRTGLEAGSKTPRSRGTAWTEENLATIEAMVAEGASMAAIQGALGGNVTMAGLTSKLHRMGHTWRTRRSRNAGIAKTE